MSSGNIQNVESSSQWANQPLRRKLFIIVFGVNTPLGKIFDVSLIVLIIMSVMVVMLESVATFKENFGEALRVIEWVMTILFTIEYVVRIWVVTKPKDYIFSFFGVIDLLSILPTYLSLILIGSQGLAVIRVFRILRIFRILKLMRFVSEARVLSNALKRARHKITVFLLFILVLVCLLGSIMYLIEGADSGFNSIPRGIYWAIVTLTTVGYGDIAPVTFLGQLVASFIMLIGYAIIAIPTGIVGAEIYASNITLKEQPAEDEVICGGCGLDEHEQNAKYCKNCGSKLSPVETNNQAK